MAKLNLKQKTIGSTGECPDCGETIKCQMSDYKDYQNKPQWQNMDGTAHLKWIEKNKFDHIVKGEVKNPQTTIPQTAPTDVMKPPQATTALSSEEAKKIRDSVTHIHNLEKIVADQLEALTGTSPNVQKVGLYVKLIKDVE